MKWREVKVPWSHSDFTSSLGLRVIHTLCGRPPCTMQYVQVNQWMTMSSRAACVPHCVQGQLVFTVSLRTLWSEESFQGWPRHHSELRYKLPVSWRQAWASQSFQGWSGSYRVFNASLLKQCVFLARPGYAAISRPAWEILGDSVSSMPSTGYLVPWPETKTHKEKPYCWSILLLLI
jgi:hypothetical protein